MTVTLELDETDYELKRPPDGMVWIGTCLHCAQDAPINREHGTTLGHQKADGSECEDWGIEPAEINREELSEIIRDCRESVKEQKAHIKELKSHYGRGFTEKDAHREITDLKNYEAELAQALLIKEKIKGRTGKLEKRLRLVHAPPVEYGTCQKCLEKLPLRPFSDTVELHGTVVEDEHYVDECSGGGLRKSEITNEDILRAFKYSVIEVSAREMALERDLIDDEKLKNFHRYLDRCREEVEQYENSWRSKGRSIRSYVSISDGEIKARALEVAYKQKKSEDAIDRFPDMAEFTYDAMRKKNEPTRQSVNLKPPNLAFVES